MGEAIRLPAPYAKELYGQPELCCEDCPVEKRTGEPFNGNSAHPNDEYFRRLGYATPPIVESKVMSG